MKSLIAFIVSAYCGFALADLTDIAGDVGKAIGQDLANKSLCQNYIGGKHAFEQAKREAQQYILKFFRENKELATKRVDRSAEAIAKNNPPALIERKFEAASLSPEQRESVCQAMIRDGEKLLEEAKSELVNSK